MNNSRTTKKLGSVNPCANMSLFDKDGKLLGYCMDTPNSFAVACLANKNVSYGKAYYQMFADTVRYANDVDIQERMSMYDKRDKYKYIETEYNNILEFIKFF